MVFKGWRPRVSPQSKVIYSLGRDTLPLHFFFESLPGCSNRSLPLLPLHMQGEETIPTFVMSNINIWLRLPNALTLTRLRLYELFRINKSVGVGECSACPCQGTRFHTGWWEGLLSRRVSHSLNNPWLELHPLFFAEKFWHRRYHSMCDFHPVHYIVTVNDSTNCHAGYKQL